MMKWKKLGQIYNVNNETQECVSHASTPFPEHLGGGIYRIYFSSRDTGNRSSIAYIDYDIDNNIVLSKCPKTILKPGNVGEFDDSGCGMGSVISLPNGEKRLYYMGWHLDENSPWSNFIGMAIYDSISDSFVKWGKIPVFDRTDNDPFSRSFPIVVYDNGMFRMWYGANVNGWFDDWKKTQWWIKTASSKNGVHWDIYDGICVKGRDITEHAFSRPCVVIENGKYRMWYSYYGLKYRIGYAESEDGMRWVRKDDEVGIDVSDGNEWDSEMIEYPAIFDYKDKKYMLYNGNGYGKTGIGLAVLE